MEPRDSSEPPQAEQAPQAQEGEEADQLRQQAAEEAAPDRCRRLQEAVAGGGEESQGSQPVGPRLQGDTGDEPSRRSRRLHRGSRDAGPSHDRADRDYLRLAE